MNIICHTDPKTLRSTAMLAGGYLIVSLLFNLLFCPNISPLWNKTMSDQAMFSIIGEDWAHGLLPNVSTWDSKGPVIFLFNMLGHLLASGENGVFILQVLNLAGVLLITHLYMRRWCSLRLGLSSAFITSWALYEACILPKLFGKDDLTEKGVALTRDIPQSDPLVAYNINATFYSYSHRLPCYRFFCFQDWAIHNSPSLRPKVRECFKSGKAKWVLMTQYNTSEIKGLLDKDYTVCRRDASSDLLLFKRKANTTDSMLPIK